MGNKIETERCNTPLRGNDFCRGCFNKRLFSALNLGELPLANELLPSKQNYFESFPLHLKVCMECGLGQVADVVSPERLFRDYRYLSSMSATFLNHAKDFVTQLVENGLVNGSDWVLEIASNDGYLLKNFQSHGIETLGIEPAENIGKIARENGVETISEFFSQEFAENLLHKKGFPKIIIANNVMAHVPDINDFLKGLSTLCGEDTKIFVENPRLLGILDEMQFDTIYHEHFSYLSTSCMKLLCGNANLKLTKVEVLKIHGGSNRYWIERKISGSQVDASVEEMIKLEESKGLFSPESWKLYSEEVFKILEDFQTWLDSSHPTNRRVFGYGAAAKASTILNSIYLKENHILAIADVSVEKQTRFMPKFGLEIISLEELSLSDPTDIVIFPWNIAEEIADELKRVLKRGVNLWSLIPRMRKICVT